MNRRSFLAASAALPLTGLVRPSLAAPTAPWRRFEMTTRVMLEGSTGPAQLWLPLAQTAGGYQTALDLTFHGTGRAEVIRDATYGAQMLRGIWAGGDGPQQIEVTQTVATHDRTALPTVPLTAAERRFWTAPTESAPTDGIVRATVERIVGTRSDPRERLRAIYDWVVDTTWRNPETPGCGLGNIKAMLETNTFGGKCADINGLMVGLARAAGIPARDVYGIRVADSKLFPSIGKSGDITKAQHCRAEAYLDDAGWFPIDPADVRKVILEQKLPIDSPEIRGLRERLFGNWEMNWVGYNSATDIELPGAGAQRPNFAFLMYPCAFTASGQPSAVDPAAFRYAITAREITA
jgi:transglutaminase-like putative cysteine protease